MRMPNLWFRLWWFSVGVIVGLTGLTLALGSIPKDVSDDTVLYQKLREIDLRKQKNPSLEPELRHLRKQERRYKEKLPSYSSVSSTTKTKKIARRK